MIKARFLPAAEAELLREVTYYSNAREGLGIKFEAAVASAVKSAVGNRDRGGPSLKGTRSRLVSGFPFTIVYRASESELLVVAIVHHRRKPGYWLARVE